MTKTEIKQAEQMIVELAKERKVPIGNEDIRNEIALRFNVRRSTPEKSLTGYGDGASYKHRLEIDSKLHINRKEDGEVIPE